MILIELINCSITHNFIKRRFTFPRSRLSIEECVMIFASLMALRFLSRLSLYPVKVCSFVRFARLNKYPSMSALVVRGVGLDNVRFYGALGLGSEKQSYLQQNPGRRETIIFSTTSRIGVLCG
ncbi:hypothetical protein QVD17_34734 [Tagetes erecta]|uniref:Uncharacterized protein n=1 Tax=Tagetes erecta TaxID=13708 RepID=A0AAD8JYT4_TARER|nr:hypothetical protein QVD17_34734 [Tagetes erecta]